MPTFFRPPRPFKSRMRFVPSRIANVVISAVFSAAGSGTLLGVGASTAAAVLSVSGAGGATFVGTGINPGVFNATGVGAASFVGRSTAAAVLSAAGFGAFDARITGIHSAVFSAQGFGQLVGVSYAFFSDAEVACLHQEIRSVSVTFEDRRTAVVPFEDRVYRIAGEPRGAGNQPRKRVC